MVLRCIRRGTIVYKEGDAPDSFHLILSGSVDVTRNESLTKPQRTLWSSAALMTGDKSSNPWKMLIHTLGRGGVDNMLSTDIQSTNESARLYEYSP